MSLPIEYVRPVSGLSEGTFPSSEALEAGGDELVSDDSMGEQMVYDGLTGNDADQVPEKIPTGSESAMNQKIPDGVDAGGQAYTVDVETMDMDEGDGSDVLVEPGEVAPPPPPRAPAHPEIPTFRPANSNGARNGVVPRNRVQAYERAAPLIQGTGAATSREGAQNFEPGGPSGPPNPAAYGYMGQAPNPLVELTKTAITAAGQTGSAAILARQGLTPPPQFQPAQQYDPATAPRQEQKTNYTPWVVGLGVLGAIGIGAWLIYRKKDPAPAPAPAAANPRRWNKKAKLRRKKFSRQSSS